MPRTSSCAAVTERHQTLALILHRPDNFMQVISVMKLNIQATVDVAGRRREPIYQHDGGVCCECGKRSVWEKGDLERLARDGGPWDHAELGNLHKLDQGLCQGAWMQLVATYAFSILRLHECFSMHSCASSNSFDFTWHRNAKLRCSQAAKHSKATARDGQDAIAEMKSRGLQPTAVTVSALLSLYSQSVKAGGKVGAAMHTCLS
jgi:hypothetical protein